jgi:hypothetical protein
MVQAWLRGNRQRIERDLAHSANRHLLSLAYFAQYRLMAPMIRRGEDHRPWLRRYDFLLEQDSRA